MQRASWLGALIPCLLQAGSAAAQNEVLLSDSVILEHDVAWLHANGFPEATNKVQVVKLTYATLAVDGSPTVATAAFVDPITTCATPLVCFIHGTTFLKDQVPSNWEDDSGVGQEGYSFAGTGMACVMPDLLGLGGSPGMHPYLHAASEATASMDAVRAAREYREMLGRPLHDQLFLMGASAGSHACMATAEAMQDGAPDEFHVAAAGGISGPYAPYPVIRDQLISTQPYGAGASLIYVLFAYDDAYPGLFASPADFLVQPYATDLPPLYDGMHDGDEINPLLPPVVGLALPGSLRELIAADPDAPLNMAFKANNVFEWAPRFPVKLCYCGNDEIVSPRNTALAMEGFVEHGALQASTVLVSASASHTGCGEKARPLLISWFRSLKVNCDGSFPEPLPPTFTLEPNPAVNGTTLDLSLLPDANAGTFVMVTDAKGATVFTGNTGRTGALRIPVDTSTWPAGLYLVTAVTRHDTFHGKLAVVH